MTSFYYDDTTPFHAAQTFTRGTAYYGVRLEADVRIAQGPNKGETRRLPVLAFVTSDREALPAGHEELLERGLRYSGLTFPEPPDARWRPSEIERYLAGSASAPDPRELYEAVRDSFASRIEFPLYGHADVCALFTIGTYVHRLFDTFPYIELHGSKESGKTKTGNVIKSLAFNAVDATALTGGALYLEVEAHGATLLLDDAENLGDEEQRAVMAMLNVGYKSDAATIRGNWDTKSARRFGVYSPKVITTIRGVNDTLATRCIRIRMQPSLDEKIRDRSEEPMSPRWPDLRSQLYGWALEHWQAVRDCYHATTRESVSLAGVSGRAWELWRPLIALARSIEAAGAEGLVDDLFAVARASYEQERREQADTREGAVLGYLLAAHPDAETVSFTPGELSEQLEEDGERITPSSLGWMLRRLGLGEYLHRTGKRRRYQIPRAKLVEVASRRGVDDGNGQARRVPPEPVTSVIPVTNVTLLGAQGDTSDANDGSDALRGYPETPDAGPRPSDRDDGKMDIRNGFGPFARCTQCDRHTYYYDVDGLPKCTQHKGGVVEEASS